MATKNQVEFGIKVSDNGTTAQATKNAEKLKQAYDAAAASASKIGGTAGSRAAAEMSGQQYGQARGTAGQTGASARDFANQAQGLGGLVRLYATYAANVFAVGAAFRALSSAMDTTNMIRGLDALGASTGKSLGSLSKRISDLTDGAVSLREAMETTAKGSAAGLSSQQMERLAKVAKNSSLALGVAMPDALNRLSRGISKLEPELLDELGIFTKIGPAVTKYAASIGRAESSLTDFERRQAFANAVLEEGEQKFAAINDQIQANPYDRLAASLKNTAQNGLELVNNVLVPIVKFLSETPGALIGVLGLLGGKILKQAGVAFSEFKNSYLNASKTIREQNQARVRDLESFTANASQVLTKQANMVADSALAQFEDIEAKYKQHIANLGKIRSTNLTKLFDPNRGIDSISEKEWTDAEKRLKTLQAMKQRSAAQEKELAAGVALFNAKKAEEEAESIKRVNQDKFDSLLKNSKAYISIQQTIATQELKATRDQIAGNFVKAQSLYGIKTAWTVLKAEIATSTIALDRFSTSMIYLKAISGTVGQAVSRAIGFIGSALNKALIAITTLVTIFEIANSVWSKNAKESQAFSSAVDAAEESVQNANRTTQTYIKTLGYFNQSSIESSMALANAFTEITNSSDSMFSAFEANLKAMSGWDKFWDWALDFFDASAADKLGKSLSAQVGSAIDLATRAGVGDDFKARLVQILGLGGEADLTFEKINNRIEELGKSSPQQIKKLVDELKEVKNITDRTAGAFDQLKSSVDALIKSQQEFNQSTASKDPLFKIGENLLSFGRALDSTFQEGTEGISAFYDKIAKSPEVLGAFSISIRRNIIANFEKVQEATVQLGKDQEQLNIVLAQLNKERQKLSTISDDPKSKTSTPKTGGGVKSEFIDPEMIKLLNQSRERLSASIAESNSKLLKIGEQNADIIKDVAKEASKLVDQAVQKARDLAAISLDRAFAKIYEPTTQARVMYEASSKELDIKAAEIKTTRDQIQSQLDLTEEIKSLNTTIALANARAKDPTGTSREVVKLEEQQSDRLKSEELYNNIIAKRITLEKAAENGVNSQVIASVQLRLEGERLRKSKYDAQLIAIEGERSVLDLNYRVFDSIKAQNEEAKKVADRKSQDIKQSIQELDNRKQLKLIAEEDYIAQKNAAEISLIDLEYKTKEAEITRTELALQKEIAKLNPRNTKDAERILGIEEARDELNRSRDAADKKRRADTLAASSKAAAQELSRQDKIFSLEQSNRKILNEMEMSALELRTTKYTEYLKQEEEILDYNKEQGLILEQDVIALKARNQIAVENAQTELKLQKMSLDWTIRRAELERSIAKAKAEGGEEFDQLNKQLALETSKYEQSVSNEKELQALKIRGIEQTADLQYKKSYEAISSSLIEALTTGGEEGAKKFRRAIENELKKPFNVIVKALLQPIVNAITGVVGGLTQSMMGTFGSMLGLPGMGSLGISDLNSLYSLGSNLYSGFTGMGNTGPAAALYSGFAASTAGSSIGLSTAGSFAVDYAAAGVAGQAGGASLTALGSNVAAAMPWVAAAIAIYTIADKLSKGETRTGAGFGYSRGGLTYEQAKMPNSGNESIVNQWSDEVAGAIEAGTVKWLGGPSGGAIGGAQGKYATQTAVAAVVRGTDALFEQLGSSSRIDQFYAVLESSEKGRGGVLSGGKLTTGQSFGDPGLGSNYNGNKRFEEWTSKTLDSQEAMDAFLLDLKQVALQAIKAAEDIPNVLSSQLADLNIEEMTADQVDALTKTVEATIALISRSEDLGLAFGELSKEAVMAAGGAEALVAQVDAYYMAFYSEEERFNNKANKLKTAMESLGLGAIDTMQEFRELVDSLKLTRDADSQLFASLMKLAPAFAEVYNQVEELEEVIQTISQSDIAQLITDSFMGSIAYEDIGTAASDAIYDSLVLALANDFISNASQLLFSEVIEPIVTSLATGSVTAAAATAATIDTVMNQVMLRFEALEMLLNSSTFRNMLGGLVASFTSVLQAINGAGVSAAKKLDTARANLLKWQKAEIDYSKDIIEQEKKVVQAKIDAIKEQISAEQELINARDEEINKLKEQKSAIENTVGKLKGFLESIQDFKKSLLLGAESPLTPAQKYAESKSQLSSVVEALSSSDDAVREKAQQDLQGASQAFLESSRAYYSSSDQYTSDFQYVMSILDAAESSTKQQLSIEEQSLNIITEQLNRLEMANTFSEDIIDNLNASIDNEELYLKSLDSQLNVLNVQLLELEKSSLTLDEINRNIQHYTNEIIKLQTEPAGPAVIEPPSTPVAVNNDVKDVVRKLDAIDSSLKEDDPSLTLAKSLDNNYGVVPDYSSTSVASGLDSMSTGQVLYYDDNGNPVTFSSYQDSGFDSGYAKGTNYLPFDQIAQVHEGERIVPKADNAKLFQMIEGYKASSDTNEVLIDEIKKLNQKIERLEQTIAEGDMMNAQATERNTQEVSRSISSAGASAQHLDAIRRRTQV